MVQLSALGYLFRLVVDLTKRIVDCQVTLSGNSIDRMRVMAIQRQLTLRGPPHSDFSLPAPILDCCHQLSALHLLTRTFLPLPHT